MALELNDIDPNAATPFSEVCGGYEVLLRDIRETYNDRQGDPSTMQCEIALGQLEVLRVELTQSLTQTVHQTTNHNYRGWMAEYLRLFKKIDKLMLKIRFRKRWNNS